MGFATDAQVRSLLLWNPAACKSVPDVPETVHLIPVDTLLYRGLWIEGFVESQLSLKEQRSVIYTDQSRTLHENRLNTGMFILDGSKHTLAPDLLNAATDFGQYHRWECPFNL